MPRKINTESHWEISAITVFGKQFDLDLTIEEAKMFHSELGLAILNYELTENLVAQHEPKKT